jgi:hypothetical protein
MKSEDVLGDLDDLPDLIESDDEIDIEQALKRVIKKKEHPRNLVPKFNTLKDLQNDHIDLEVIHENSNIPMSARMCPSCTAAYNQENTKS